MRGAIRAQADEIAADGVVAAFDANAAFETTDRQARNIEGVGDIARREAQTVGGIGATRRGLEFDADRGVVSVRIGIRSSTGLGVAANRQRVSHRRQVAEYLDRSWAGARNVEADDLVLAGTGVGIGDRRAQRAVRAGTRTADIGGGGDDDDGVGGHSAVGRRGGQYEGGDRQERVAVQHGSAPRFRADSGVKTSNATKVRKRTPTSNGRQFRARLSAPSVHRVGVADEASRPRADARDRLRWPGFPASIGRLHQ